MKKIVWFGICVILLFSLTGCGRSEEKNMHDKLDAELEYVEDLIFKITNKYAKGEYLEEEKVSWEAIKDDVANINDSWSMMVLDLTDVHVQNKDIIDFSNYLNDLLISVSQKSEVDLMKNLSLMYEKMIIFKKAYNNDQNRISKNEIKSGVLKVFEIANQDNWEGAKTQINSLIEKYKGLMNDIRYAEENAYNLNKIYVLLEEFSNSIDTKNFDLVRIKYINTVENL